MSSSPIAQQLSPYDTGQRHVAHPWIPYGASVSASMPAENFGKVDFDDDEGSTTAVVHLERNESGRYLLHIQPLCSPDELDIVVHD